MTPNINPRKTDALPMLPNGFKVIGDWQIDQYFYAPFTGGVVDSTRRLHLVNNLQAYLSELKKFDLQIEVWIDGSFTTKKPDPEDVDIVVFVYKDELNALSRRMAPFFSRLTTDREYILARYEIDVYLAFIDDPDEVESWTSTFTQGHSSYSSKGFFKLKLIHV